MNIMNQSSLLRLSTKPRSSSARRWSLSRRWALGIVLSSVSLAAVAQAGLVGIGKAKVSFLAQGPAGLKIEGKGGDVSTSEAGGKIKIAVGLTKLSTGIDMRDSHLKKALNVKAHPKAVLLVSRGDLKFPQNDKSIEASTTGKLTLNGKTRDTKFSYKVTRTGSDYHVQGRVKIDITKFKMEIPCYLGVCVNKDVKVKVKFKVRDK